MAPPPPEKRIHGGTEGTAFQISPEDFVTAAHVLRGFVGARYSKPVLVGPDNRTVYEIDSVQRYDEERDIAVIRLWSRPPDASLHPASAPPDVGAPVHFAGTVRIDATADEYDGRVLFDIPDNTPLEGQVTLQAPGSIALSPRGWPNLLRFAPSPRGGMSGGPLLDEAWQVIGMVVAEDPDLEAARAIPIDAILSFAKETSVARKAVVGTSSPYDPASECDRQRVTDDTITLPRSFSSLSRKIKAVSRKHVDATLGKALREKIKSLEHERRSGADRCDVAGGVAHQPDEQPIAWVSSEPGSHALDAVIVRAFQPAPVTRRGAVRRLHPLSVEEHLHLAALGHEHSLGIQGKKARPDRSLLFRDGWNRIWRLRQWQLPQDERVLISLMRELPDGYLVITKAAPTAAAKACTLNLKWVTMRRDLSCRPQE